MNNSPRYPHSPYHLAPIAILAIRTRDHHGADADLSLLDDASPSVRYLYGTNCRAIIRTEAPYSLPTFRAGYICAPDAPRPYFYLAPTLDAPPSHDALGPGTVVVAVQPRATGTPYYALRHGELGRRVTVAWVIANQQLPDWY